MSIRNAFSALDNRNSNVRNALSDLDNRNFNVFLNRHERFRDAKNENFEDLYRLASVDDRRGSNLAAGAQRMGQFDPNDPLASFNFDPSEGMANFVQARGSELNAQAQSRLSLLGSAFGQNQAAEAADINSQLEMQRANHSAQMDAMKTQGLYGAIGSAISGVGTGMSLRNSYNQMKAGTT